MENTQITLTMTAKQVNIILAHLSKGIFGDVVELVNLITSQGNAQIAEVQKPKEPILKAPEKEQEHGMFVLSNDEKPAPPIEPSETEAKPDIIN